eukprot:2127529-Ditylum_brightwellii.AAC.1
MTTNKNENCGSITDSIMVQEEAEVGHFCWDSSDKDETEAMKVVEDGKEKWHQVEIAIKRKAVTGKLGANNVMPMKQSCTMVTFQRNAASATKTVAEIMKEQGERYVEDKNVLKTPVEVQWVLNWAAQRLTLKQSYSRY